MLIKDYIQRILSLYTKGVENDATELKPRHIYNKLLTTRNLLLYQKANKRQKISEKNYQTISCIEMVKAPLSECPCLPPTNCYYLRSKYEIPGIVNDISNNLILSVNTLDGETVYAPTNWVEKRYKRGNRYTSNRPDYFFKNNFLYLIHTKDTLVIEITAIFSNPLAAVSFEKYCKNNCTDCEDETCISALDTEFPLDPSLQDSVITMSAEELLNIYRNTNNRDNQIHEENQET